MVNIYNANDRKVIKEKVSSKSEFLLVLEENKHLEELSIFGVLNGIVYQGLFTVDEAKQTLEKT